MKTGEKKITYQIYDPFFLFLKDSKYYLFCYQTNETYNND